MTNASPLFDSLRAGRSAVWAAPARAGWSDRPRGIGAAELAEARARLDWFAPALSRLFAGKGWDGRIASPLIEYPEVRGAGPLLVKCDHALPMTGSIKARGGIYEVLLVIEMLARAGGLLAPDAGSEALLEPQVRAMLGGHKVVAASTGNLGFSIGLAARAFGLGAEIHMSSDAKAWKKQRLKDAGATVIEHDADYSRAIAIARDAAARDGAHFIDDEGSMALLAGYACAGEELAGQLAEGGIAPTVEAPLFVYLPCGVGGAPAGLTLGLKRLFGDGIVSIFVEPAAAPCMFATLATGGKAVSVYDLGFDNRTAADGLAVPKASQLALDLAGDLVDAAVAVPDEAMARAAVEAWDKAGLRLELSAAAGFAALEPVFSARGHLPDPRSARHLVWTTGGSMLPGDQFEELLGWGRSLGG